MNNLTFFLYMMDVTESASHLSTILCVASVVAALGLTVWFLILGFNTSDQDVAASKPFFRKCLAIWTILFVLGWSSSIALPARSTMMLMAGSELGERIVNSKQVTDVVNPGLDLLKTWIKSETAKLAKDK